MARLPGARRRGDRPAARSSTAARATARAIPSPLPRPLDVHARRGARGAAAAARRRAASSVRARRPLATAASIALVFAGSGLPAGERALRGLVLEAPHVFVEDISASRASPTARRRVSSTATCASGSRATTATTSTARSGAGTAPGSIPASARGTSRSTCRASASPVARHPGRRTTPTARSRRSTPSSAERRPRLAPRAPRLRPRAAPGSAGGDDRGRRAIRSRSYGLKSSGRIGAAEPGGGAGAGAAAVGAVGFFARLGSTLGALGGRGRSRRSGRGVGRLGRSNAHGGRGGRRVGPHVRPDLRRRRQHLRIVASGIFTGSMRFQPFAAKPSRSASSVSCSNESVSFVDDTAAMSVTAWTTHFFVRDDGLRRQVAQAQLAEVVLASGRSA